MPKLILTVGASASGKSTWAEEFVEGNDGWINLNRDDVRFELFTDGYRDWNRYKFNKTNENQVSERINYLRDVAEDYQANIVVSDTNLNPKVRKVWQDWAAVNNYEFELKLFPCDWSELVKRNAQRQGGLKESLLYDQFKRYMQQFGAIGEQELIPYTKGDSNQYTIIVDIDGTIADMTGVRKPFDWNKVGLDKPRNEIIDMVLALGARSQHITFMSGRDGVCYYDTIEWIEKYVMDSTVSSISWDLVMRKAGDVRKDYIVKYELFNEHIRGKFEVDAVFDDRDQVLQLWDLLDLPNVINVGGYQNKF